MIFLRCYDFSSELRIDPVSGGIYIARQGIHINRINAENTNEISVGDSSGPRPLYSLKKDLPSGRISRPTIKLLAQKTTNAQFNISFHNGKLKSRQRFIRHNAY
jgi:hypothetical protein